MSVAIRTAVRLQDQDDVNVSLGAGVDEYALCWDNDTARFVLRAPFAGLLATGATTGATSQAQTFTNGIVSPFSAPASDGVAAWQVRKADKATAVLNVDTTNGRVGIGTAAPANQLTLSLSSTVASPAPVLRIENTSATAATGTGGTTYNFAVVSLVAGNNSVIGQFGAHYGTGAVAPWTESGFMVTTRSNHPIIFWTGVTTTEKMRITNAGLVGIGTTTPGTLIHGLLTSGTTAAVTNVLTIGHDTSGTAANGFGAGQLFALETSTTAAQSAARIQALWYEATHATRKADLVLTAYDSGGEREGLRIRGAGSAAAIGFLGAPPAARVAHVADPSGGSTVDSEARSAINSILATLETFGFHATS